MFRALGRSETNALLTYRVFVVTCHGIGEPRVATIQRYGYTSAEKLSDRKPEGGQQDLESLWTGEEHRRQPERR